MSTVAAISIQQLGKRFELGETLASNTLRDAIAAGLSSLLRARPRVLSRGSRQYFWALKDVSFDVDDGEVVGIIGHNGAGKSTLLKILSQITEPTEGEIYVRGRIASLLEVGTGFHQELSGRENVFMNGAILGMSQAEIRRKFDEIVAFAGVEKFIDTPVKRYSSGMLVRLGFAVAAHLEPEILIVDEVLAVGDAEFQRKCLGKMDEVSKSGRTILFVSHNMAAIEALCSRVVILARGRMLAMGETSEMLQTYARSYSSHASCSLCDQNAPDARLRFLELRLSDPSDGTPLQVLRSGQRVCLELTYDWQGRDCLRNVQFSLGFFGITGNPLFICNSAATGTLFQLATGCGVVRCEIPKWPLPAGRVLVNLRAEAAGQELNSIKSASFIDCEHGDFYGTGRLPGNAKSAFFVDYSWH